MLEEQRQRIDQIDRQLVNLFEERMHVAQKIAEIKVQEQLPILNSQREQLVLEKVSGYLEDKELVVPLNDFYLELLDISKKYQAKWQSQLDENK